MPFETKTVLMQRIEFIILANKPETNISLLCKRFGITRKTGYKWLKRFRDHGMENLMDNSKRPWRSPGRIPKDIENHVVEVRKDNQSWGSKKIHRILINEREMGTYPFDHIPCKNTITMILKRNGLISQESSQKAKHWERFEHASPNELWQMDFKGYFTLEDNTQCHPLTILDDHSRYNLGLYACSNEKASTVKEKLILVFSKYGLPNRILADNGSPWGAQEHQTSDNTRAITKLEKWLMSLNINITHGKPYHPQTQGKEERFHRTLKAELLQYEQFSNLLHCQKRFDWWREKYNCFRPHEAIELKTPASRYQTSNRSYSDRINTPEYDLSDFKRKVDDKGFLSFKGKLYKVGKAFYHEIVALRPTLNDGIFNVYFYNQMIRTLNLKK